MNEESKNTLSIAFTGNITIERETLEQLIRALQISNHSPVIATVEPQKPFPAAGIVQKQEDNGKVPRLAFTMKETAEILGVSYITVHRLIQRRLLRSSLASRKKIIAKTEIERFLKDTSRIV
jgi:hypothetical protein